MWANRITLEDHVKHDAARIAIQKKLKELGCTDECIPKMVIECDGGYLYYEIYLTNDNSFRVFDDGTVFEIKR